MPSQDFTGYIADIIEKNGKREYYVHIEVTNADGDCTITKTNVSDSEDVEETFWNIDSMKLREELLSE